MSRLVPLESQNPSRIWTLMILMGAAFLVLFYLLPSSASASSSLALVLVVFTFILIGFSGILARNGMSIDISDPLFFYGLFYFIYYLIPYTALFFYKTLPEENALFVAALFLIGYLAFLVGVKVSGVKSQRGLCAVKFRTGEEEALLMLCIIGIGLVAYIYAWRTANGIFFNQAAYYEQALDVASSFRDVFIQSLQLPIILLLALLSSSEKKNIKRISRFLFIAYSSGICFILLLSSQTRPCVTALIFAVAGVKFYRRLTIRLHHFVIFILLSATAVFLVQGLRMLNSEEFAMAENQFSYAVQNIVPSALSVVQGQNGGGSAVSERAVSRAGGGIFFLSDIIDRVKEGNDFSYGQDIIYSLYSFIPRFLWENKPTVIPTQLVIERLFGLPDCDAAVTPIIQFYSEAGWIGVVAGYFIFGWLMGKMTRYAFYSGSLGGLMILFFVWGHVVNIEAELVVGLLSTLRGAVIVFLLHRIIVFFSGKGGPKGKNAHIVKGV